MHIHGCKKNYPLVHRQDYEEPLPQSYSNKENFIQ